MRQTLSEPPSETSRARANEFCDMQCTHDALPPISVLTVIRSPSLSLLIISCIAVLLCACLSHQVGARSNGILTTCDLSPVVTNAGKPTETAWPYGLYGRNKTVGAPSTQDSQQMRWADWPQPSNYYSQRTADDSTPDDDPKSYIPGQLTSVHIRVLDLARRWIGITMYATNGTGTGTKGNGYVQDKDIVVGDWSIPPNVPLQVINNNCTRNGGNVVTHQSADYKPIHTRVYFTAPKGTGTVTLKMLIKQGEQNKGSFFYLTKPLVLTEAVPVVATGAVLPNPNTPTSTGEPGLSTVSAVQWLIGEPGQACANVCLQKTPATPYCHSVGTKEIYTLAALAKATDGQVMCRLPLLQGCPYSGAAHIDADGFCSFRVDSVASCPKTFASINQTAIPPANVCFTAAHPTHRPICTCTNVKSAQLPNPFAVQSRRRMLLEMKEYDEPQTFSAASGKSVSTVIIAAISSMMSVAFTKSSRVSVFLAAGLLVLSLATPSHAHNYIKSRHRAREAAVSVPCQARIGTQPHVQVVASQTFEVEWSIGHGDIANGGGFYYFATVREDDYQKLAATNITAIILDYIAQSPVNASIIPDGWNKQHIRRVDEGYLPDYFAQQNLTYKDPSYIIRDDAYRAVAKPSQYQNQNITYQHIFKPQYLSQDKRATYTSSKYPWILSASIFYNYMIEHAIVNNQANIARFQIPKTATPGNHIVYFNWAGYKDCIDVNVMPGTSPTNDVVARYGVPPPTTGSVVANSVKMDHCEFNYQIEMQTNCRIVDKTSMDASACIADCQKVSGCTAVQVVRKTNPNGTLPWTPNIPFSRSYNPSPPVDGNPCTSFMVHERTIAGCPPLNQTTNPRTKCDAVAMGIKDDDYICYGLYPARNQDLQVEEDQTIAIDKEDPKYYSTCFIMDPDRKFLNIPAVVYTPADWNTYETCVDCAFHNNLKSLNSTQSPRWADNAVASTCKDCSVANSQTAIATFIAAEAGANQKAAGRKDAVGYVVPTSSSSSSSTGVASSTAKSSSSSSSTSTGAVSSSSSSGGSVPSSTSTSSTSTSTASTSTPSTSTTGGSDSSSSTSTNVDLSSSSSSSSSSTTDGNTGLDGGSSGGNTGMDVSAASSLSSSLTFTLLLLASFLINL